MFFNFAVQWLPRHPDVKQDIQVTPALRQEFFRFVEASKFSTAEELERQWNEEPNKNLLDLALRIDIANVARAWRPAGRSAPPATPRSRRP